MITIFTMAFNEEILMPFMIEHYRTRFSNCRIVVRDNQSTDKTVNIAHKNDCEVIPYDTNGQIDDIKLRDLKNNCWKEAKTDWVLVCDIDELLDITEEQLIREASDGVTIIKAEGYNMINMEDNFDLNNIKYGERFWAYDKAYLFNKSYIKEIGYECGAHKCHPVGHIKYSDKAYLAYHYKFINMNYTIERYKLTAERLSAANKANGMGAYNMMPEEQIRKDWLDRIPNTVKIR